MEKQPFMKKGHGYVAYKCVFKNRIVLGLLR